MRERGGEGGQKASLIAERNMQKEICGKKYAERNMPNESKRKGTRPSSFSCLPSLSLSLPSLSLFPLSLFLLSSSLSLSLPSLFFPPSLSLGLSHRPSLIVPLPPSLLRPSPHNKKPHQRKEPACMCLPKYSMQLHVCTQVQSIRFRSPPKQNQHQNQNQDMHDCLESAASKMSCATNPKTASSPVHVCVCVCVCVCACVRVCVRACVRAFSVCSWMSGRLTVWLFHSDRGCLCRCLLSLSPFAVAVAVSVAVWRAVRKERDKSAL